MVHRTRRQQRLAGNARSIELQVLPSQDAPRRTPVQADEEVIPMSDEYAEPGKLFSHRQLLQPVWGPTYSSETQYLRQYIAQLRRKFEEDPHAPASPDHGVRHGISIPVIDHSHMIAWVRARRSGRSFTSPGTTPSAKIT
jgi:hypothetical protein